MAKTKEELEKIKAGADAAASAGKILDAKKKRDDNWVSRLKSAVKRRLSQNKAPSAAGKTDRDVGIERGVGSALTKEELDKMRTKGVKK